MNPMKMDWHAKHRALAVLPATSPAKGRRGGENNFY
jgi:hypothetical protein